MFPDGVWTAIRLIYAVSTNTAMLVFVRAWSQMMPTHSYFFSMSFAIGFIPVYGILLLFVRYGMKKPVAVLDAPWPMIKQSIFLGLTFAFNAWGMSTSAVYIQGPVMVILSQLPLALAAIFSALVFRRRYSWLAWFGVLMVITGTVVQATAPGQVAGSMTFKWCVVFFFGNLPIALWAPTLEGFHKAKHPLDGQTNTMELRMMWTNFFLILWLLVFIPFYGWLDQPPFESFWDDYQAAWDCVFQGTANPAYFWDDCQRAGWVITLAVPIAALQVHSQIVLSRGETGLFATLALTLAPFLGDLFFPYAAVMGPYADPVSEWDALAAVICFFGVLLFGVAELKARRSDASYANVDQSAMVRWFSDTEVPQCLRPCRRFLEPDLDAFAAKQRLVSVGSDEGHVQRTDDTDPDPEG